MTRVTCTTVELVDPQAGHNKLYRTYVADNWCVFQHGPRTIATGGGRWIGHDTRAGGNAWRMAQDKINEEVSEGYRRVGEVTFDYAGTLSTNKADLQPLDHARVAAGKSTPAPATPPPAPAPAPPPVAQDRHAEFTARALAAVSLAATDPQAALLELALLRDQWDELAQIHARAASYLETLNTMLLAPAAP